MTKKLYDIDSHMKTFDAVVTACKEDGKNFLVELDQTAFFPEGGGQYADTGTLNDVKVVDVQEIDGRILHKVTAPFSVGDSVVGTLDWEQRFDRMQNHTGEHIICGTIHKLYGYNNVGFHLGELVTMDIDGMLTNEQLAEVERIANEAVYANAEVTVSYPTKEELEVLEFRSKEIDSDDIRIVTVDGYDRCACCAPHVKRTGEIGTIKIAESMAFKKGMRLTILCGRRAMDDYKRKHELNKEIMGLLSAKVYETSDAVAKLLQNYNESKKTIKTLSEEKALLQLGEIITAENGISYTFTNGLSSDDIRYCVNKIMDDGHKVVVIFSGDDASGYRFTMGSREVSLKNITDGIKSQLKGNGGGSDTFFQGKIKTTKGEITAFFNEIEY